MLRILLHSKRGLLLLFVCLSFINIVAAQAPTIIINPYPFSTCPGSKAYFSGLAGPAPITYRWLYSPDGTTWDTARDGTTFSGTATNALVVYTNAGMNHYAFKLVAENTYGYSTLSNPASLLLSNNIPGAPTLYLYNTSFCQGADPIFNTVAHTNYADTLIWSYTGTGVSFVLDDPMDDNDFPRERYDTFALVSVATNATSGNISVVAQNACGTSAATLKAITINPISETLAGTAGGAASCSSATIGSTGAIFSNPSNCNPLNTVIPSGTNPVTGNIQSCVTIDASVQSYNGIPYVQRHYNIEPSTNPTTSTATVTLYFTQSDFDTYNSARGSNPPLPTGPADATGISNLQITQFHGTGTTPGTYVGGSGNITPSPGNVVWNATASRWEVTFNITGFSGFFASSTPIVPLPLILISFSGQSTASGNLLTWTTSSEVNTSYFEVQRNPVINGNSEMAEANFQTLTKIAAAGNSSGNINYSYTDPFTDDMASENSYRLKMTDIDGKFTYSKTIVIQLPVNGLQINVTPNPFHNPPVITISSPQTTKAVLTIADLSGKLLLKKSITLNKGSNYPDLSSISTLQQGMYLLTINTGTDKRTLKLIKD